MYASVIGWNNSHSEGTEMDEERDTKRFRSGDNGETGWLNKKGDKKKEN